MYLQNNSGVQAWKFGSVGSSVHICVKQKENIIFSVLVLIVYSGEYDVTLSAYPHRTSLKNMPGHGDMVNTDYKSWERQFLYSINFRYWIFFNAYMTICQI
jgi:hypothetical protein